MGYVLIKAGLVARNWFGTNKTYLCLGCLLISNHCALVVPVFLIRVALSVYLYSEEAQGFGCTH